MFPSISALVFSRFFNRKCIRLCVCEILKSWEKKLVIAQGHFIDFLPPLSHHTHP